MISMHDIKYGYFDVRAMISYNVFQQLIISYMISFSLISYMISEI